jgi:hypothetical protein
LGNVFDNIWGGGKKEITTEKPEALIVVNPEANDRYSATQHLQYD